MSGNDLVKTVSMTKINDGESLHEFLGKVEEHTISLMPKAMVIGTRPDLIITTRLVYIDNVLPKKFFYKDNKKIEYDSKSNGDIFCVDKTSKLYAIHAHKLKEIALAAGIKTSPPRRDNIEYSDNRKTSKVKYSIDWERLDIDGTTHKGTAEGFYDYEQQVEKYKKEGKDGESGDADQKSNNADKQRGDAEKLAIANAYVRAIKDALPEMKLTFSLQELAKPLLVPKVIKDLSALIAKYPDIEKMLLAKELGISNELYNVPNILPPQQQLATPEPQKELPPPPSGEPLDKNISDASFTEIPPAGEPPTTGEVIQPKVTEQPKDEVKSFIEPTEEEKQKIAEKEWCELDQEQRTKQLNTLIVKKGYKRQSETPVEKYTVKKQWELLNMLNQLADKS